MAQHRTAHSTPRDVFLHLLGTWTLFVSVISLLTVVFQYINIVLPDPLNGDRQSVLGLIRGASASLIVAFPIFVWISSILHRDVVADPGKRDLPVRKWLIYFTLFVAAVSIISYLITLVNGLYGGELTLSFALKALSVLIVTGTVFGYYLWDVRQAGKPGSLPSRLAWGSGIVVAALLVAGVFIAGTPAEQRRVRMDLTRVSDLQSIQQQVVSYWIDKGSLPNTTSDLSDTISGFTPPVDPATREPYGYRMMGMYRFELCATFETTAADSDLPVYLRPSSPTIAKSVDDLTGTWAHGTGQTCFARTIDPERYKTNAQ